MHRLTKVALVVALVAAPLAANARSTFLSAFNTRYGTTGTVLDSCNTCHPNGTSSFNAYANDLIAANISTNATNAYAATDPLDSDKDGYTNRVEIDARTFPGLATSFPVTSAPKASVSPTSLAFGTVTVGSTKTMTTTVSNTGNAPLSVTSVARCSTATSTEFTATPASFTVAAGASATVTVSYKPVDATTDSGCIAVASNDTTNPTLQVSVSGTGQAVVVTAPKIGVSPTSLAFGTVTIGTTKRMTATVANTGNAPLSVTSVARCTGTSTEFTATPASFTVAAGTSATVTVAYAPADTTTDSGCIAIASNDTTNPTVQVSVSGTGQAVVVTAPKIGVSPTSLAFGTVTIGTTKRMTATVANTGNAPLAVTSVARCTGTSTEFTATPASFTVAAGTSATVTVAYAPADTTADSGCIAIASNDTTNPTVQVSVSGTGQAVVVTAPGLAVDKTTLAFGTVTVGSTGSATLRVTNDGNAPLASATVAPCTGTSNEFAATPATITNLAAGATAIVTVTYAPSAAGSDSGCFNVAGAGETIPVSVSGAGQAPVVLAPAIAVAPTSLTFGTIDVGSRTQLQTVVSNTGNADLVVSSVALCAGTSTEFSASPASFTVAPGANQTVSVAYAPVDVGTDSGCVAIASNDTAKGTQNVSVSGTAQAVSAPVGDVDVSRFTVARRLDLSRGTTTTPKLSLVNPGTIPADYSVLLEGVDASGLAVYTETLTGTLAAGATGKLSFRTFVPTATGTVTWTVTLTDADPDADVVTATTNVTQ